MNPNPNCDLPLDERMKLALHAYKAVAGTSLRKLSAQYCLRRVAISEALTAIGEQVKKRRYAFDERFFAIIDSEEKAYWLGFIVADGCITKNESQMRILLSDRDKLHLEKFARIFEMRTKYVESFDKRNGQTYKGCRLLLSSRTLCKDLIAKGVRPQKSKNLDSTVLHAIPDHLMSHFIRGYFDGDGCIDNSSRNEYRMIFVGTECFLTAIAKIISNKAKIEVPKIRFQGGIYRFAIAGNGKVTSVRDWMYAQSNVYLERKKIIADNVLFGRATKTSKFRGVHWCVTSKQWQAKIYHNQSIHLGFFDNEEEAAQAYDKAVVKLGLNKYRMNFKEYPMKANLVMSIEACLVGKNDKVFDFGDEEQFVNVMSNSRSAFSCICGPSWNDKKMFSCYKPVVHENGEVSVQESGVVHIRKEHLSETDELSGVLLPNLIIKSVWRIIAFYRAMGIQEGNVDIRLGLSNCNGKRLKVSGVGVSDTCSEDSLLFEIVTIPLTVAKPEDMEPFFKKNMNRLCQAFGWDKCGLYKDDYLHHHNRIYSFC